MALNRLKSFAKKSKEKISNLATEAVNKVIPSAVMRKYINGKLIRTLGVPVAGGAALVACSDDDNQAKQEFQTTEQELVNIDQLPWSTVERHIQSVGEAPLSGGGSRSLAIILYNNEFYTNVAPDADPNNPYIEGVISAISGISAGGNAERAEIVNDGRIIFVKTGNISIQEADITIDSSTKQCTVQNEDTLGSRGGTPIPILTNYFKVYDKSGTPTLLINNTGTTLGEIDLDTYAGSAVTHNLTLNDITECDLPDKNDSGSEFYGATWDGAECDAQSVPNMNSFDTGSATALESCKDVSHHSSGIYCNLQAGGVVIITDCGDGAEQGPEECDDGNNTSGDGCSDVCVAEAGAVCDNSIVEAGEDCDPPDADMECTYGETSCTKCDSSCQDTAGTPNHCGDSDTDSGDGEECDDGNSNNNDACKNDCSDNVCGDGVEETGVEDCDPPDVDMECAYGETTCDKCDSGCNDAAGDPNHCGDGDTDSGDGEACDDANSSNEDACTNNCEIATCGDGYIRAGVEYCETGNNNGETCITLGYVGGTLSCSSCDFDTSNCDTPPDCGNSQIDTGEDCDDADLNGGTCQSEGFDGGDLTCSTACAYDTRACTMDAFCGDGNVDPGEDCEPPGTASCDDFCQEIITPDCGNSQIDPSEICDGDNLNNQTCESQGFDSGDLACADNCGSFVTDNCVSEQPLLEVDDSCANQSYLNKFIPINLLEGDNPFQIIECTSNQAKLCGRGSIDIEYHEGYTPISFELNGDYDEFNATWGPEEACFVSHWSANEGVTPARIDEIANYVDFFQDPGSHIALNQSQLDLEVRLSDGSSVVAGLSGTAGWMNVERSATQDFSHAFGEATESSIVISHMDETGTVELGSAEHRAGTDNARFEFDNSGPSFPPDQVETVDNNVSEPTADTTAPDTFEGADTWPGDTGADTLMPETEADQKNDPDCGCSTIKAPSTPKGVALMVLAAMVAAGVLRKREDENN
ncbi:hypothetical protein ACFL21_02205 [Patescibacteria group bacterium]